MFKLHGIYAPIATPFAGGEIAYDKLEKNLSFWLGSDLEGIVVMGSNGEFVLLSPAEKEDLMRFVCARAKGKKPVIAGTGAESTAETMRLNEKAALAGADAVLVVTPNYYKGSMTDPVLARFYTDVAEASPLPVILYNMPRNAGINISAKLAVELARHPKIIGVKDSGGNIVQIADIIRNAPADFSVFAGSASFLYASLVLGATGGTLALANIFPNECARLQTLFDAGKIREARDLQMNLIDSNNAVTARWGIPGLKAAMEMIGLYGGDPRPPLMPLKEADREELRKVLTQTGFFPKAKA
ncbi:MAG: dihydrodipicolinate synthase family protein [Syntrophobacterales bacterium CG03_land_8_20_14_0_80_58_14]|nr:MAG: dihydrodipicolinate synthase family protein [Syntrophobacterales bacterium CG03_land_8_20_14_0_80_58_14]